MFTFAHLFPMLLQVLFGNYFLNMSSQNNICMATCNIIEKISSGLSKWVVVSLYVSAIKISKRAPRDFITMFPEPRAQNFHYQGIKW